MPIKEGSQGQLFKLGKADLTGYRPAYVKKDPEVSFSPGPLVSLVPDSDGPEEKTSLNETCESADSYSELLQKGNLFVRAIRAVSMRVPVTIFEVTVDAIIDSGAEVTVLSQRVFNSLPEDRRPMLQKAEKGLIVAEENRVMPADGVALLPLILGQSVFKWSVYIAPITDDLLLGCDLLDAKDITINTRKGLLIDGKWLPCGIHRRLDSVARVVLPSKVTLPANSEYLIQGRVHQAVPSPMKEAILEPLVTDSRKLLVARALVDCSKGNIPVRLVNLSGTDIHLKSEYPLGELHPVETVTETKKTGTINDTKGIGNWGNLNSETLTCCRIDRVHGSEGVRTGNPEIPEHLQDLYTRSLKNIGDDTNKQKLASLLCEYQDVFARSRLDLGSCSIIKHKITTNEAAPIRQHFRRTPKAFEKEEEAYLQEQLDAGVIIPSDSAWASPVVLVRKKDQTVRWCCDFRKLNEVTIKDAYPLPRIDMCLDCLGAAKYFTTMDLQSGYWQLEVDPVDRHKTAFTTKYGLFEYAKLPMGLCNAPSTFQRCMELILRGLQWKTVLIYLDDIIIFSPTIEDHLTQLAEVLRLLQSAGLKLKPSKCDLLKKEVVFLGHVVNGCGVSPNPKLISAVKDWKEPSTVRQVQQFLGLCNYYRRFIYQFSNIAAPLSQLTQKDSDFEWSPECQIAFDGLKAALCDAPILAYPKSSGMFVVDTDASNVGIGGVLSQIQDGEERVICFASKKLNKSQRRYCVTRRELLAVVVFLQEFRHYLLGQQFILRTDHNSLRWICNFKAPQGQLSRWLEVLSQYDFKILHRDGKKHGNADAMSRVWCDPTACDCYTSDIPLDKLPCGGCTHCTNQADQWKLFDTEVDDIIPLSCPEGEHRCLKIATRNTVKKSTVTQDSMADPGSQTPIPVSNWVISYSAPELMQLQREDPDLVILHDWLDTNAKPNRDQVAGYSPDVRHLWIEWERLQRTDGVLYIKWINPKTQQPFVQLLVPKSIRNKIIELCHDTPMSGHFGVEKTMSKLKQRVYWRTMKSDVSLYIQKCPVCSANRQPKHKPKASLVDYRVGHPMDRLGIDILGPLPQSNKGNVYILVIADYFTRWIEAYPLPNQTAETTANALLYEFMSRFGFPFEIHSDQGRNFQSDLFQELCKILGVTKTRSTPYHPASDGLVERFNQTLAKMIRSFTEDHPNEWDKHLPLLTAAYRCTVHPATGFTPNFLMFGREVNIPADLLFPPPADDGLTTPEYVEEMREHLTDCYNRARQHLKSAAKSQKRNYDTRIVEHTFRVGDAVYKRNPRFKKLELPWLGPYIIQQCLGATLYRITDKRKSQVVHHDALKPYNPEKLPAWAKKTQRKLLEHLNPDE